MLNTTNNSVPTTPPNYTLDEIKIDTFANGGLVVYNNKYIVRKGYVVNSTLDAVKNELKNPKKVY